jgi:hypothetical protein
MAVKPEIIKARLRYYSLRRTYLKRLDVYAAKLAPKPTDDDADDATIDAIINDYNEVIDFEAGQRGRQNTNS